MFRDSCFEIPQYFSHQVLNGVETKTLTSLISDLKFRVIIFSGFPFYFAQFIRLIKKNNSATNIYIVYHGSPSQWVSENTRIHFYEIIKLYNNGFVNKIGFVKKGMKNIMNEVFGISAHELMIPAEKIKKNAFKMEDEINIGVPGTDNFNKNLHNQVAAALMIPIARVHVLDTTPFQYMNNKRVTEHGRIMPKNEFINLLGSMSINLYLSYSECFPQVVTESLAMGVPCITSNNNGIFDHDAFLKQHLVADEYDNPMAISRHIQKVLDIKDELSEKGVAYIDKLNSLATQSPYHKKQLSFSANVIIFAA
jgi:glycosyltransferase involved in cell wall biosynthesis